MSVHRDSPPCALDRLTRIGRIFVFKGEHFFVYPDGSACAHGDWMTAAVAVSRSTESGVRPAAAAPRLDADAAISPLLAPRPAQAAPRPASAGTCPAYAGRRASRNAVFHPRFHRLRPQLDAIPPRQTVPSPGCPASCRINRRGVLGWTVRISRRFSDSASNSGIFEPIAEIQRLTLWPRPRAA